MVFFVFVFSVTQAYTVVKNTSTTKGGTKQFSTNFLDLGWVVRLTISDVVSTDFSFLSPLPSFFLKSSTFFGNSNSQ